MIFGLNPSSGNSDSYFDIEFSIVIGNPQLESSIKIYNDTSGEQLNILGVDSGVILNGNEIIVHNKSEISGYINLFNDDKMNKKFRAFNKVSIRCTIDCDNKISEQTILFYNEDKSIDAEVVPIDVIVHNHEINLSECRELLIDVISDRDKRYELCIRSSDDKLMCPIEISARKGRTSIKIPIEILYYDLELATHRHKTFSFYYVKLHGTNFSRLANRKYLVIPNSDIRFVIPELGISLYPQSRLLPNGEWLNDDFIVSDRYMVMCPKEFSGLSSRSQFDPKKLMDLTMLVNEGQDMEGLTKQMQTFAADDSSNIQKINRTIQTSKIKNELVRYPHVSLDQLQLMNSVSGVYDSISSKQIKISDTNSEHIIQSELNSTVRATKISNVDHKCEPCSRKKKQNG